MILDTDKESYGGFDQLEASMIHETATDRIHRHYLSVYLPFRTAIVLERQNHTIICSKSKSTELR
jgi:hypothetical protein